MACKSKIACAALMAGLLAASPAFGLVSVTLNPLHSIVAPGGTVDVQITATWTQPLVGWGLDLTVADPTVAQMVNVQIEAPWIAPPNTIDGDGLAGLAFPNAVPPNFPTMAPLATVTFQAIGNPWDVTDLLLSYGPEEDEGFAIDPLAGGGLDPNVGFFDGTLTIIPEPASLALLALGGLALLRRR